MRHSFSWLFCILFLSISVSAMAEEACDKLTTSVVVEVFGNEASVATFRPGSKYVPNSLCSASWQKPDHDVLAAAYSQYETKKAMAKMMKKPFAEDTPALPNYSVSLTILDQEFDSPEAAVASLESAVAELTKGVSVTIQGEVQTTQVEFGDWLEGIGNKAIWAPKLHELQVADDDGRFAVGVEGFSDGSENFSKAVELARQIAVQ